MDEAGAAKGHWRLVCSLWTRQQPPYSKLNIFPASLARTKARLRESKAADVGQLVNARHDRVVARAAQLQHRAAEEAT